MTPEAKLEQSIKKYIEKMDGEVFKQQATMFTRSGTPDLLIWYRGFAFFVETKVKGNYPSAIQKAMSHRLADKAIIDVVAYSLDDVKEVVELIDWVYDNPNVPIENMLTGFKDMADKLRYTGKVK